MKKILALPFLIVAGCSAPPRSFEAKLALTPLPIAQAVASKSELPVDPQRDVWERKLKAARTSAATNKALKDVHTWQQRTQVVGHQMSLVKDPETRARLLQQQSQITDGLRSLERAVMIKAAQVKANDFNDSTGEVAKCIESAHQFQANATKIMKSTGSASCCGGNSKQ